LDWDFLEAAFGWLLWDTGEPNPLWNDPAEFQQQRQIVLSLWAFEVWLNHRPQKEREDDRVPHQLGFRVIATIAKMTARAPLEVTPQLWGPVLRLGAAGHYSVDHFITCWFLETFYTDPKEFGARWGPMIEYALTAPEWSSGRSWYYGQKLLRQILGYGSEATLGRRSASPSQKRCWPPPTR
jgi:hypothetical protein